MKKINYIISYAEELNDKGVFFPIWATCLGFESLIFHELGKEELKEGRIAVNDENQRHKIHWNEKELTDSLIKQYLPSDDFFISEKKDLMVYFHKWGFSTRTIEKTLYRSLATSQNLEGKNFVAYIEHEIYPFIGAQFHPEKTAFEHKRSINSDINLSSIKIVQDLSRMILALASKNFNYFLNQKYLNGLLFKNWESQKVTGAFETIYLFKYDDFKQENIMDRSNDKIDPF